jgi:hypothetical protein
VEELVGSSQRQVHLHRELESNDSDRSSSDNDIYIKVALMVYLLDRSDFQPGRIFCAAQAVKNER